MHWLVVALLHRTDLLSSPLRLLSGTVHPKLYKLSCENQGRNVESILALLVAAEGRARFTVTVLPYNSAPL